MAHCYFANNNYLTFLSGYGASVPKITFPLKSTCFYQIWSSWPSFSVASSKIPTPPKKLVFGWDPNFFCFKLNLIVCFLFFYVFCFFLLFCFFVFLFLFSCFRTSQCVQQPCTVRERWSWRGRPPPQPQLPALPGGSHNVLLQAVLLLLERHEVDEVPALGPRRHHLFSTDWLGPTQLKKTCWVWRVRPLYDLCVILHDLCVTLRDLWVTVWVTVSLTEVTTQATQRWSESLPVVIQLPVRQQQLPQAQAGAAGASRLPQPAHLRLGGRWLFWGPSFLGSAFKTHTHTQTLHNKISITI